jgi:hypothetical protein
MKNRINIFLTILHTLKANIKGYLNQISGLF